MAMISVPGSASIGHPTLNLYWKPYSSGPSVAFSTSALVMAESVTLDNLYVNIPNNTASAACTITLWVNNAATSVSVTVPAGNTGNFSDLVNSASVSAGDLISFQVSPMGTGSIGGNFSIHSA